LFRVCIVLLLVSFGSNLQAQLPTIIGEIRSDTINSRFGWTIVPLGDQNDDGYDDLLVYDLRNQARVYYGGDSVVQSPVLTFFGVGTHIYNIGDVDGDGYDDVVEGKGAQKPRIYLGGPDMDTVPDATFGSDTRWPAGPSARGNDLDQNGVDDFVGRVIFSPSSVQQYSIWPPLDSLPEREFRPVGDDTLNAARFGRGVATGDFNGDGLTDLAIARNPSVFNDSLNGSVYLYWGGPSFDTIPELIITRPGSYQTGYAEFGEILVQLGDVSGDNYDDLLIGSQDVSDSLSMVYFGGPLIDSLPDLTIDYTYTVAGPAYDINGDSVNDILVARPLSIAGAGSIAVFYGGPTLSSQPDLEVFGGELPGLQFYFGTDITGIGDFNNDGKSDYAFSSVDLQTGVVYIASGTSTPVDVEDITAVNLPVQFHLNQNYPNPFNSGTNITFDLVEGGTVSLLVINLLGKTVRTLVNERLSPGSYRLEWDGLDDQNSEVASGIYFYTISQNQQSETRKMILLK